MSITLEKGKEMLYLTRDEVLSLGMTMQECIDIMEQVYIEKGKGNTILPPKFPMHPIEGYRADVTAMPACNMGMGDAGVKIISGFSTNYDRGLPYIHALEVIMDIECGVPLCVMDASWVTGIRTGAVTGLAAKTFANPDSQTATIIGLGIQGRVTLDALMCGMKELKKIYISDKFPASVDKYLAEMQPKYPTLEFVVIEDLEAAIRDTDILVTCIPNDLQGDLAVIKKEWLKEGSTIMPIDGGLLLYQECMEPGPYGHCYTDDVKQFAHFRDVDKYYPASQTDILELGKVLVGEAPGRESHEERILALLMGNGLVDLGAAQAFYKKALEKGVGTVLPL